MFAEDRAHEQVLFLVRHGGSLGCLGSPVTLLRLQRLGAQLEGPRIFMERLEGGQTAR